MTPKESAEIILKNRWGERGLPVDPVAIAHELGIKVIESKLPDEVSGALIKDKGSDPVIYICNTDSLQRKRFSCAHELGHYFRYIEKDEESYELIDFRNSDSSSGTNEEEVFANRFAACLLMPEKEIKNKFTKKNPAIVLAHQFGVSDEAMHFRLRNLGLL